jgi:hypothetical protein
MTQTHIDSKNKCIGAFLLITCISPLFPVFALLPPCNYSENHIKHLSLGDLIPLKCCSSGFAKKTPARVARRCIINNNFLCASSIISHVSRCAETETFTVYAHKVYDQRKLVARARKIELLQAACIYNFDKVFQSADHHVWHLIVSTPDTTAARMTLFGSKSAFFFSP